MAERVDGSQLDRFDISGWTSDPPSIPTSRADGSPEDAALSATPALKAKIVAEAMPYLRRYTGQTVLVKYGEHAMGNASNEASFAGDIVLLRQVGINPIVVHGGGPQIGQMLGRLGIESSFVNGLRVTDSETMKVVEMVLAGTINKQLVASINAAGGCAVGLSGKDADLIRTRKTTHGVNLGFVGEPDSIDCRILNTFRQSGVIPVIAPIGVGAAGDTYNMNADTVAGAVAAAVKASRFLLLTDVPGVLDADRRLIRELTSGLLRQLIDEGTISGGMIPKIETCFQAVTGGVEAAVILDGRVPHALLLELFTEGLGTMIRAG